MKKLFACLMVLLTLLCSTLPLGAQADEYVETGMCGENVRWTFSKKYGHGVLYLSGEGDMDDYYAAPDDKNPVYPPWHKYKDEISRVKIEEGITNIGRTAFYGYRFSDGDLPSTLKEIGDMAFWGNAPAMCLTIPEGVVRIGEAAFANCSDLNELVLPSTLKELGDGAFADCPSLWKVEMPSANRNIISVGAFSGSEMLNKLDFFTWSAVSPEMFMGCAGLQTITIPGGVTQVMERAFADCSNLMEIRFPITLKKISGNIFQGCEKLATIHFYGDAPVVEGTPFAGGEGEQPVKATAYYPGGNETWTEDVMSAFGGEITWVPFDAQEVIADGRCGDTMTWTLTKGGTLTISGTGDMDGTFSLIYTPWYDYRDQIGTVIIEPGVESIGSSMLAYLKSMTSVTIPDTVTFIGSHAFLMSSSLTSVSIPESVTMIDDSAFRECSGLKEISMPGVTYFGIEAFKGCTSLTRVTIGGAGKTELAKSVFEGCSALTDVTILDGVGSLTGDTFKGCISLRQITIPSSVKSISSAFVNCTALEKVQFENGIQRIGTEAFEGCKSLKSLTFPSSVKEIDYAFQYCSNLTELYFQGNAPKITPIAFSPLRVTCYYPSGNNTWNQSTCKDYGGTHTKWVKYDHIHSYTASVVAPTCTEKGYTAYVCVCGDSYQKNVVPASGHKEQVIPAVPVTCTEDGLTEGILCTVCGETLRAQEVIPAGHAWNEGVTIREATYQQLGIREFTCGVCGEKKQEDFCLRLSGANRFDTAFKVADQMKASLGVEKFDAVIVASGTNFADALSGSYLAAVKNAPILLSFNDTYNNMAKDYIRNNLNEGGTVYILGGENAVPVAMEEGLEGFEVKRLAGGNRFETNLAILEEAGVGDKPVLVCTGLSFADSLSASASELPILLVWNDLTEGQKVLLEGLGGDNPLYVIGGEGAVSAGMEEQVAAYGDVKRIGGSNRFETSVLIAEEFFEAPTSAALAYAWNYPDGLCGGPLAAVLDVPLILTMNGYGTAADAYSQKTGISGGVVLGGENLISDDLARDIFTVN